MELRADIRREIVRRNNPILKETDEKSILSIGNGNLAFSADITGLQTFYNEQRDAGIPLCTMSQWGWHSTPDGAQRDTYYSPNEVIKTKYFTGAKDVYYASNPVKGNENIYHWLRENPHRINLIRVALIYKGNDISRDEIMPAKQELDLYGGILHSFFSFMGAKICVESVCGQLSDVLGFKITCSRYVEGLGIRLSFPYGASDITGSDWEHPDRHSTRIVRSEDKYMLLKRTQDRDIYYTGIYLSEGFYKCSDLKKHSIEIGFGKAEAVFTISLFQKTDDTEKCRGKIYSIPSFEDIAKESRLEYEEFWNRTGIISFKKARDARAAELERRVILSIYLLKIQSLGMVPPQETGLTCNSWYGKFHLEMYIWHCAWAVLWNNTEYVMPGIDWYMTHLECARANAKANGYRGARWPKMVDSNGVDSPSHIATLLIWQQPHIIFMLEMIYRITGDAGILEKYNVLIRESAVFMCDYALWNEKQGVYELPPPLIPAQEEFDPSVTKNPAFELEYWRFGLEIAAGWERKAGDNKLAEKFQYTASHMKKSPVYAGVYISCENCNDTFERYNKDHPSMLGALGLLDGSRIDRKMMKNTLIRVLKEWKHDTLWGWDYAMIAMCACRLCEYDTAIDILLCNDENNFYAANGNNFQKNRKELPLYLPGNGSLLLALPLLIKRIGEKYYLGGNSDWEIEFENVSEYPF